MVQNCVSSFLRKKSWVKGNQSHFFHQKEQNPFFHTKRFNSHKSKPEAQYYKSASHFSECIKISTKIDVDFYIIQWKDFMMKALTAFLGDFLCCSKKTLLQCMIKKVNSIPFRSKHFLCRIVHFSKPLTNVSSFSSFIHHLLHYLHSKFQDYVSSN
jgi:hypothetical protein